MRELVWSVAAVLCLGGCASTAPPVAGAPAPQTDETAGRDAGHGERIGPESVSTDDRGEPEPVLVVAEVPAVEAQTIPAEPPKRICRRVKPTGSHRTQRVCYTQREVDASTAGAREVFDELHRQQQLPPIP